MRAKSRSGQSEPLPLARPDQQPLDGRMVSKERGVQLSRDYSYPTYRGDRQLRKNIHENEIAFRKMLSSAVISMT